MRHTTPHPKATAVPAHGSQSASPAVHFSTVMPTTASEPHPREAGLSLARDQTTHFGNAGALAGQLRVEGHKAVRQPPRPSANWRMAKKKLFRRGRRLSMPLFYHHDTVGQSKVLLSMKSLFDISSSTDRSDASSNCLRTSVCGLPRRPACVITSSRYLEWS